MAETSRHLDRLRVIGSPEGFAVYDNAKRKLNVMALDLFIRPGNPPLMQIAMPAGEIDVEGKSLFAIVDLATGKPRVVKRIEWADGESTDFPEPEKAGDVVNSNGPDSEQLASPMHQKGPEGPNGQDQVPNEPTGPPAPNATGFA